MKIDNHPEFDSRLKGKTDSGRHDYESEMLFDICAFIERFPKDELSAKLENMDSFKAELQTEFDKRIDLLAKKPGRRLTSANNIDGNFDLLAEAMKEKRKKPSCTNCQPEECDALIRHYLLPKIIDKFF